MDIYLTDLGTGKRIGLSWLPEEIKLTADAQAYAYTSVLLGEVEIPAPSRLEEISFTTKLPGASRKNLSFIKKQHWLDPAELAQQFRDWKNKGTKLRLLITETKINMDVRIASLTISLTAGPAGDHELDLVLKEARDLVIYTIAEVNSRPNIETNTRPTSPAAPTGQRSYTVKTGDTLWGIARTLLGNGMRYTEIYNLNKTKIKPDYIIYTGQVFAIPAK